MAFAASLLAAGLVVPSIELRLSLPPPPPPPLIGFLETLTTFGEVAGLCSPPLIGGGEGFASRTAGCFTVRIGGGGGDSPRAPIESPGGRGAVTGGEGSRDLFVWRVAGATVPAKCPASSSRCRRCSDGSSWDCCCSPLSSSLRV